MIRFITFEGGDGTGKTTQIRAFESWLASKGKNCVVTREPGGSSLGATIRKMVVEVGEKPLAPAAELFLYLADRAQHVAEVIQPAVAAGKIVLCDRFTDSTLAYQGYGRGLDLSLVRQFNSIADGGMQPDLTFVFDCQVEVGLGRTAQRQAAAQSGAPREDRFEREKLEFHERVRQGFLALARLEPARIRVIDASVSVEEVTKQIRSVIEQVEF